MYDVLNGLDSVLCYIDYLLVFNKDSKGELGNRTYKVLKRFKQVGMTLNPKKCFSAKPQ